MRKLSLLIFSVSLLLCSCMADIPSDSLEGSTWSASMEEHVLGYTFELTIDMEFHIDEVDVAITAFPMNYNITGTYFYSYPYVYLYFDENQLNENILGDMTGIIDGNTLTFEESTGYINGVLVLTKE